MLERTIERAARTMLDLRESWIWSTKKERWDLVRMMLQGVGVDVAAKQVVWVKARPDFDVLFQLFHNLQVKDRRRFWILYPVADENIYDIGNELGQRATEAKIASPVSHNTFPNVEEYKQ